MDIRSLPAIVMRLISDGAAADAAVARIASASLSEQRVVRTTLGEGRSSLSDARISAPGRLPVAD